MKKKLFCLMLSVMMLLMAVACADAYDVTVPGHNGDIKMAVTIDAGKIADIQVLEHADTPGISDSAFTTVIPAILEQQTLKVDTVTGATVTSTALINGVKQAIEAAGLNPDDYMKDAAAAAEGQEIEKSADVVVLGSGLAGFSAALEARRAGASVLLLEKMPYVGGNTLLSGGYMYGHGSKLHVKHGVEDTVDDLVGYWLARAHGNADEKLLRLVAEKSGETIDWLMDSVGVEFDDQMRATGTSAVLRCTHTVGNGRGLIPTVYNKVLEEGIEVLLETPAVELIEKDGKVCGVIAASGKDKLVISAKAVILATGGFDADMELIAKYSPELLPTVSANVCPGNTGDGIRMAEALGAATVFKGGLIGQKVIEGVGYAAPMNASLRGLAHLSVTEKGARYVNETADYPVYIEMMHKTGCDRFFHIVDSEVENEYLEEAVEVGAAFKADTLEELAQITGMDTETFLSAVARYNDLCERGVDVDYGKAAEKMIAIDKGPFYAIRLLPSSIGSLGGVKIDLDTHVVREDGSIIEGLYAAGAVANGDFFNDVYPASGSAVMYAAVTGRIAGQMAGAAVK